MTISKALILAAGLGLCVLIISGNASSDESTMKDMDKKKVESSMMTEDSGLKEPMAGEKQDAMKTEMKKPMKAGTEDAMKTDMEKPMKAGMEETMKTDMEKSIKAGTEDAMKTDMEKPIMSGKKQ